MNNTLTDTESALVLEYNRRVRSNPDGVACTSVLEFRHFHGKSLDMALKKAERLKKEQDSLGFSGGKNMNKIPASAIDMQRHQVAMTHGSNSIEFLLFDKG